MTSPALTVTTDTPVDQIMEMMVSRQLTMVPVVAKGNSQLVGVISRKNIINATAEYGFWPEHEFKKRV
jgi:CBS domain-containing protein